MTYRNCVCLTSTQQHLSLISRQMMLSVFPSSLLLLLLNCNTINWDLIDDNTASMLQLLMCPWTPDAYGRRHKWLKEFGLYIPPANVENDWSAHFKSSSYPLYIDMLHIWMIIYRSRIMRGLEFHPRTLRFLFRGGGACCEWLLEFPNVFQ